MKKLFLKDEQKGNDTCTIIVGSALLLAGLSLSTFILVKNYKNHGHKKFSLRPIQIPEVINNNNDNTTTTINNEINKKFILWFDQIGKYDSGIVGGKGANLGELSSAGFPVPPGFCITKFAFETFIRNTPKEKIEQAPLPPLLEKEILDSYKKLSEITSSSSPDSTQKKAIVAIRSSATAEDSADASFAGQLETYLGLCGNDEIIAGVKKCWASLFSKRAESYSSMAGKTNNISCCVVVQLMLDADVAGVMFTANPISSNLKETVITGNWGLGESVVADITVPDTWIVSNESIKSGSESLVERFPILGDLMVDKYPIIKTDIAQKKKKVILQQKKNQDVLMTSSNGVGHSIVVDIPNELQDIPCLNETAVFQLVQMGIKVKKHYENIPQDIEWGFKDGRLYLLQTRPITTLQLHIDQEGGGGGDATPTMNEFDAPCRPDDFITTCNAAEMFPGAMTPLTMSTFGRMADEGVQRLQIDFGVRDQISKQHRVVGTYYGNLFLNMTNTLAPVCAGLMAGYLGKENGEMAVLGKLNKDETLEHLIECAGGQKSIFRRLINGARYVWTMIFAYRRIPRMLERIDEGKDFLLHSTTTTTTSDDGNSVIEITGKELWERIDEYMVEYDNQWADGIVTSSTSGAIMLATMKLLSGPDGSTWGNQSVGELATLLGDSIGSVAESAEAVGHLDKIRDAILLNRKVSLEFVENSLENNLNWILNPKQSGLIGIMFFELLERHGHRCINESEMRMKDWAEDPSVLVKLLVAGVKTGLNGLNKPPKKTPSSTSDVEKIISSKKHLNFITKPLLRFLVRYSRRCVHLRELGKSLQIKLNSVVKRAYRKLGNILVKEGKIADADYIYFLTHQELGIVSCSQNSNKETSKLQLRAIQRRRLLPQQNLLKFPELSRGKPIPLQGLATGEIMNSSVDMELTGTPVSSGIATGIVRVIRNLEDAGDIVEGEILVCPQTDIGWSPYFSIISGLITEIGGLLSHGAVCAREISLPCVVGVPNACSILKTGQVVKLNGNNGVITILRETYNV